MENETPNPNHLLHSIKNMNLSESLSTPVVIGIVVGALLLGAATGYGISAAAGGASLTSSSPKTADKTDKDGSKLSAGVLDKETFPDSAEGVLQEGGFEGEGSYHLERPGGDDQTAYLTSTAVDLSEFVGKKVKVWGKTYEAEKAGWLMDVGYVEVKK